MKSQAPCWPRETEVKLVHLAGASLLLIGCTATPDSYPIPPQQPPVTAPEPYDLRSFFSMGDRRANAFLIDDVRGLEANRWRWTGQSPHFRFPVFEATGMDAMIAFTIADATFRHTGPLRLEVSVNGHLVGRHIYPTSGDQTFRQPVPGEWLRVDAENDLQVHIENPWTDQSGITFGILVREAGFIRYEKVAR